MLYVYNMWYNETPDPNDTLMSRIVTVYDDDPNRLLFFTSHVGDRVVAQNAIRRGASLIPGAVMCASIHNHHTLVKYLVKKYDDERLLLWNHVLAGACFGNQTPLITQALTHGADDYDTAFECSCQGGHLSLVKRFLPQATHMDHVDGGFYLACQSAQHKVIDLLRDRVPSLVVDPSMILPYVVKSGNLRLIKSLTGQRPIHLSTLNQWLIGLAYHSSTREIQQVLDEGATDRYHACLSAIKGGNDPVIERLGYCVTSDEAVTACLEGQKRELLLLAQSLGELTPTNEEVYNSCLRRRHELLSKLKTRCYDYLP